MDSSTVPATAFFDIGDTLASVTLSADGTQPRLAVYPHVPAVLEQLRERGVRLGIVSNRGSIPEEAVNQALRDGGLWEFFVPELVIYGPKDSPAIFRQAASAAGDPARLLFVGEDATERAHAGTAGFAVAPHPLLAVALLDQPTPLRYLRITVPPGQSEADWAGALVGLPVLPVHVAGAGGGTVYAIATSDAAAQLDDLGFWVDRLGAPDEPLTTDLYLLRDDRQQRSGFLAAEGNSTEFFAAGPTAQGVLASTGAGLLVAVPAGVPLGRYHFAGTRHGHNLKLSPTVMPLRPRRPGAGLLEAATRATDPTVAPAEKQVLESVIQAPLLAGHVARYSGAQPLDDAGVVITSRHCVHPDNPTAVAALAADLQRIGGPGCTVSRHRFTHRGRRMDNVVAEFPGTGLDGIVLVTAHLDSTGARGPGYREKTDPAPGADDDGSGVAGVLAAAQALVALDREVGSRRRTVRFALFNAEEDGLVGSLAYAAAEAGQAAPITAVFQLDMIGYDVLPERTFELHAGFSQDAQTEARSVELTELVAKLVPQVSPGLPAPQLYPFPGEVDLAEQRSDHYSFQLQGYPACLASEDLFAGPGPDAPPEEMNPNYHMATDTVLNAEYAADITRVVTAAAWLAATR
jgi:hypothetical protein